MSLCLFRDYYFMTSKLVSLYFFPFVLLGSASSVYAAPMLDNLERNDSALDSGLDSALDKTEPKTVFEAVVRQLEQNEKVAVSKKNKGGEIATTINLALSKTVSEAVVEDTAERLAREVAEIAEVAEVGAGLESAVGESAVDESAVDEAVKDSVSKKMANRQLEDEKPKQLRDVKQKTTKEQSKLTQGEMLTANFIMRTQQGKSNKGKTNKRSGWVYLGHFVQNDWLSKTLDIKKSLPTIGRNYTVMHSLNMRVDAPTNSGAAQLIKKLEKDDSVKILKVRPSGRNGHYWAQVEYRQGKL